MTPNEYAARFPSSPSLWTRKNRYRPHMCSLTCQLLMRTQSHARLQHGRRGSTDAYCERVAMQGDEERVVRGVRIELTREQSSTANQGGISPSRTQCCPGSGQERRINHWRG